MCYCVIQLPTQIEMHDHSSDIENYLKKSTGFNSFIKSFSETHDKNTTFNEYDKANKKTEFNSNYNIIENGGSLFHEDLNFRYVIYPLDSSNDTFFLKHFLDKKFQNIITSSTFLSLKDEVQQSSYYFIIHRDDITRSEMKKNLSILSFENLFSSNIIIPYLRKKNLFIHPENLKTEEDIFSNLFLEKFENKRRISFVSVNKKTDTNFPISLNEGLIEDTGNELKRISFENINSEAKNTIFKTIQKDTSLKKQFSSNKLKERKSILRSNRKIITIFKWHVKLIDHLQTPWIQYIRGNIMLYFKEVNRKSWSYFIKFVQFPEYLNQKNMHFPDTFHINLNHIEVCLVDINKNYLSIITQVDGILTTLRFSFECHDTNFGTKSISNLKGFINILKEIGFKNYCEINLSYLENEIVPSSIISSKLSSINTNDEQINNTYNISGKLQVINCDFEHIASSDIWTFVTNFIPKVKIYKKNLPLPFYVKISQFISNHFQSSKIIYSSIVKYKQILKRTLRLILILTEKFILLFKIKNPYHKGRGNKKWISNKGMFLKLLKYDRLSSIVDACWRPPTYGKDDANIQLTTKKFQIVFSIASLDRVRVFNYILEKYRGLTITRDDHFKNMNHSISSELDDNNHESEEIITLVKNLVNEELNFNEDLYYYYHELLMKYCHNRSINTSLQEKIPEYILYLTCLMNMRKIEKEIDSSFKSQDILSTIYSIKYHYLLCPQQRNYLISKIMNRYDEHSTEISNNLFEMLSSVLPLIKKNTIIHKIEDSIANNNLKLLGAIQQHLLSIEGKKIKLFEQKLNLYNKTELKIKSIENNIEQFQLGEIYQEKDLINNRGKYYNNSIENMLLQCKSICRSRIAIMERLSYKNEFGDNSKILDFQKLLEYIERILINFNTNNLENKEINFENVDIISKLNNFNIIFALDFDIIDILTNLQLKLKELILLPLCSDNIFVGDDKKNQNVYKNQEEKILTNFEMNTSEKTQQKAPILFNIIQLKEDGNSEDFEYNNDLADNIETLSILSYSENIPDQLDSNVECLRDAIVNCEEEYEKTNIFRDQAHIIVNAKNSYAKEIISAILNIINSSLKNEQDNLGEWMNKIKTSKSEILSSLLFEFEEMKLISNSIDKSQRERAFIAYLLDNNNIDIFFQQLIQQKEEFFNPSSFLFIEESHSHQVFSDCIFHILANRFQFSFRDYSMEEKPIKYLRDTIIRIILEYKRQKQLHPEEDIRFSGEVSRGEQTKVGRLVRDRLFTVLRFIIENGLLRKELLVKPHPWNFITNCFFHSFSEIEGQIKTIMEQSDEEIQFIIFQYLHLKRIIEMLVTRKYENDKKIISLFLQAINGGMIEELFIILIAMSKNYYKPNSILISQGSMIIEALSPLRYLPFNMYVDD